MKFKKLLSWLKHKKVILLISSLVILVLVLGIFAVSSFFFKKETKPDYSINEVEQILYQQTEPYSEEDELYIPVSKESIQYKIEINKKNNVIVIYKKDGDGKYTEAFKSMTCSVGRDVPLGTYVTGDRYVWKLVNGNVWAQYATRLEDAIMIQSVPFEQRTKDTLITKYYNQLGSNCNAFSIRLNVADAKWIVENASPGTSVEVLESDDIGPLGKPKIAALEDDIGWDPSDPDPSNPGNGNNIYFMGLEDKTVERGITIDYLSDVKIVNENGIEVSVDIEVKTDVNIYKCGTYEVTFSASNASGGIIEETVEYTVIDTMKPVFSGIPSEIVLNPDSMVQVSDLLTGVYVIDNNQFIATEKVKVSLPDEIKDGDFIRFSVSDDYGNETVLDVVCVVDTSPPEIRLKDSVGNVLANDQIVDKDFALSRVVAFDNNEELPSKNISVSINRNDWGYTFTYTVKDKGGLTAQLKDTVSYPIYEIVIPEEEYVDDLTDLSLLKNVQLKDSEGRTFTPTGVKTKSSIVSDNYYLVNYEYEYSSVLGTRTATCERYVRIAEVDTEIEPEIENENEPEEETSDD